MNNYNASNYDCYSEMECTYEIYPANVGIQLHNILNVLDVVCLVFSCLICVDEIMETF